MALPEEPLTRREKYLSKMAGEQTTLPEPITREEMYLAYIAQNSSGADPAVIAQAVEDYLDEHGVTVTEQDPTVPSWAKAESKPTYTASEVGALPDDTSIPSTAADVGAIAVPANPTTGAFLTYNGSAWIAQTLSVWQGGSY